MNLCRNPALRPAPAAGVGIRGFTVPEMLVSLSIFTVLIAVTVSSHLFGLRMYGISDAKLVVTADARRVLNHLREEVWSGKVLFVGNGNSSSFTLIPENAPHLGNALKICATADTNSFVYYFLDTGDSCLKRMVSSNSQVEVIARNVTNRIVFRAEDFQGNPVTNYLNNKTIALNLQIRKPEWNGNMFEYYQLQTRIARRAIE
jgi:prepilin-type N-terminal cleavage/methylation domain-containing protein